jgi:hypothetical protein
MFALLETKQYVFIYEPKTKPLSKSSQFSGEKSASIAVFMALEHTGLIRPNVGSNGDCQLSEFSN